MNLSCLTKEDLAILVVEDSPTQAEQIRDVLEQRAYRVTLVKNGKEALASIEQHRPTIVISDVVMPEMGGYDLCKAIKSNEKLKDVPVILLTSLGDPVDVMKGLECGVDNFIVKPYEEEDLLSRIQFILLNRELYKSDKMQLGVEILFAGQRYFVTSGRQQILNLLLSTYETAVQRNLELIKAQNDLRHFNEHLEELVEERTATLKEEILERQRAEDALRENLACLTALLQNLHVGVLFEDHLHRVVSLNPKLCEMFALEPRKQWLGADCRGIVETVRWLFQDPEAFQQGTELRILSGQTVAGEELILRNGRVFERDYVPIRVDERRRGHLWLYRDVTERKQAEQALRDSEAQLRQAQKMEAIGRLAGGVAHDFNNLLTAIVGYAEMLLLQFPAGDPVHAEIEEIRKAGERASGLTRQLLALSRRQLLQPKVINLSEVVAGMDKMLRRLIGEDIDLVTRPSSELWKTKADPGQIEQVILNLAVNARDAMPEGGKLTIGTANIVLDETYPGSHLATQAGDYVMLAASDTGSGMTPEVRARIFEPFFTTKEPGKGTGLGLSTTYGIVKQSGGSIWVYSEPGHGTTFKIYLPRVADESARQRKEDAPQKDVSKGYETILLVEDDETVRTLVRKFLAKSGYTVLEASSGNEALELSRQHPGPIQLMVTDVVMPGTNLRGFTETIAMLRPDTKVLYVSGYTDDAIVRHGVLEEGMHFVQKPFTAAVLERKVRSVLDGV